MRRRVRGSAPSRWWDARARSAAGAWSSCLLRWGRGIRISSLPRQPGPQRRARSSRRRPSSALRLGLRRSSSVSAVARPVESIGDVLGVNRGRCRRCRVLRERGRLAPGPQVDDRAEGVHQQDDRDPDPLVPEDHPLDRPSVQVDLYRRPVERVVLGNKWIWVAIILLVNTLGAIIYLGAGRKPATLTENATPPASPSIHTEDIANTLYGPRDGTD